MKDNGKSCALVGAGCLVLVFAGVFGFAPFVFMTGSNLSGADGYFFGGWEIVAVCIGIAGIAMFIRAYKIKRR